MKCKKKLFINFLSNEVREKNVEKRKKTQNSREGARMVI